MVFLASLDCEVESVSILNVRTNFLFAKQFPPTHHYVIRQSQTNIKNFARILLLTSSLVELGALRGVVKDTKALIVSPFRTHSITESSPIKSSRDKASAT